MTLRTSVWSMATTCRSQCSQRAAPGCTSNLNHNCPGALQVRSPPLRMFLFSNSLTATSIECRARPHRTFLTCDCDSGTNAAYVGGVSDRVKKRLCGIWSTAILLHWCLRRAHATTCHPTEYLLPFKAACPTAYS